MEYQGYILQGQIMTANAHLSNSVSGRMQNSSTPCMEYLLFRLMLSSKSCRYSEVFEMR